MKCNFEEKQYEGLLNFELAHRRKIFQAGQVFEHEIAIDSALYTSDQNFRRLWSRTLGWRKGLVLTPELWEPLKVRLDTDLFPRFKCNVFIQYKRPEFIKSGNGKEFEHWKKPYFRYDIDSDQQSILEKLERKIGTSAIVAYACASFYQRADLWVLAASGNLVENSNFARPSKIMGHDRYAFIKSGKTGWACSEPEAVPCIDLFHEIDGITEATNKFENNSQFLKVLSRQIRELSEEFSDEQAKAYELTMRTSPPADDELTKSIDSVLAFTFVTGTSWLILYR